jgi:pimeloyl-ACP methyl ester carboxylesterase
MRRLFRSFYRLFLPVIILFVLTLVAASVFLVYKTSEPPRTAYLVTPDKYGRLSSRAAQVTDETWTNADGTQARGWLLRGAEKAPAVVLLHHYGADRSHLLNLGVKLNEATDFTVLMPDLRGHGENPPVVKTSFGGCETEDALAAIKFLRELKTDADSPMVGQNIGIYGVELGAIAGLLTAAKDDGVKAFALDSVPNMSDSVLASAVEKRFPFAGFVTGKLAQNGTYLFYAGGCYNRNSLCDAAKTVENRNILLLAGTDSPALQDSTDKITKCLPDSNRIESKTDLNPSGFRMSNASVEQIGAYDLRIIEFFKRNLQNVE